MSFINNTNIQEPNVISELLNSFQETWNKKNAHEMAALFSEKAEFTDIMGQIALGRERIEQMHAFVFARFMKEAKMSHEILYMRNINENQVLITCTWKTTGHTNPKNKILPDRKGVMQVVVEKFETDWQIILVHNLDFTTMYNSIDDYRMRLMPATDAKPQ